MPATARCGNRQAIDTALCHVPADPTVADGVEHWHPHQLCRATATRIHRQYGLEADWAVRGHKSLVITEIYTEQGAVKVEAVERLVW